MMKLLIVVVVIALLLVLLRLLIPHLGTSAASGIVSVNGKPVLADCPDSPNCQGSQSSRHEQQVEPLQLSDDSVEVIASIANRLNTLPGMRIVSRDENYLHVTSTSPVLGFVDDIEFLYGDEDSVQIRSASRLGYSDLGANRKRIERLRKLLHDL